MHIPSHIFREYDIRGVVDQDLSEKFAFLLGRAYATKVQEVFASAGGDRERPKIAIGWDCRHTSAPYAKELANGMAAQGVEVVMTGMGPTPQLYFALHHLDVDGGIQVTGSHNPSNMNGFKVCMGTSPLSGEDIDDIRTRMEHLVGVPASSDGAAEITDQPLREIYIETLIERSKPYMGPRELTVVVDAGNGAAGVVGPEVLRGLGVNVIELYCEPDGDFPNHHPDPTVMENIRDLITAVKENGADFGIGWDGDGDRIGVVDQNGEVIFGDMLTLIYARALLEESPGATVVADVKCSSLLFSDLEKRGAHAVMYKTGHSLMKKKLHELGGALAGEMSGHIVFQHRFFGFDDALYCSGRLAEIMSHQDGELSSLLADLPETHSTPEIRLDCPEEVKFALVAEAQKAFGEFEVNTIDGVRISFDNGWALVRASNTQPVLVMRFEATNQQDLDAYRQLVEERIAQIRDRLAAA